MTSTSTRVNPASRKPSCFAAAHETSITRPRIPGPRSLIFNTVDARFLRLVTRTVVPKGSFRWAAVSLSLSNISPLAVGFPWRSAPYQLAIPTSPLGISTTRGSGAGMTRGLASVVGDRAINPATAQPITIFLIQPPTNEFTSSGRSWMEINLPTLGLWKRYPSYRFM